MKKHYTIYVPAFIYDDIPITNEAILQLDGAKPHYFASVAAAIRYVKQDNPYAYIEERRCV